MRHDRVLANDQTCTLPGAARYIYSQVLTQEAQTILDGDVARVLAWTDPFSQEATNDFYASRQALDSDRDCVPESQDIE